MADDAMAKKEESEPMDLDMEDLPEEEAGDGQTGEVSAPENQRAEEIKAAEAKDHLSDSQDQNRQDLGGSSKDLQRLRAHVNMLTALILRHDNQINIASLLPEDGYTGSMATALYQTGVFSCRAFFRRSWHVSSRCLRTWRSRRWRSSSAGSTRRGAKSRG
ncbi:unnamed protein product [Symbiodinium necroappetens]|uniref:Uncharacterized protein n=1 Tax=Symbiodinium necroappetens TaxID=1628268 RepID=A0A812UGN8_9DINO|nr:unnamed protein product [Symbiodinium necroappetens]